MHHLNYALAGKITTIAIIAAMTAVILWRAVMGEFAAALEAISECYEW